MDKDKAREQAWSKTQRRWHKSGLVLLDREAFDDLFDVGYDARDAEDRWVPIRSEDDLPKENGEYIWQHKDGGLGSGHYHSALHKGEIVKTCIAWKPLPAPYVTALSGEGE